MIYTPERIGPEFAFFDTFISQDRPTHFRRFRVPLKYHDWSPSVNFDNCVGPRTLHQGEPLVVDPTQAFILLELSTDNRSTDVVIFLRIQALVEQACLMGADADILEGTGEGCRSC